jgi:hypothetical protein
MSSVDDRTPEELLGELLAMLPPAPAGWVAAARELPSARRALEEIDQRVLSGAESRARETAELEAALQRAGLDPSPERVAALRRLLDD